MKKLVIGDIHIEDNFIVFLKVLFPFLEQIIAQYDFDEVIILGDVFDVSNISNTTMILFKKLMTLLENYKVDIIIGNHDRIDARTNIFDLLIYKDNVNVISKLTFKDNEIYLPHVVKIDDLSNSISRIKTYISENNFESYFIYSHNDFNETYKFTNKFVSFNDCFCDVNQTVYLINGHNHVPVFKKNNNLKILNIGNAINLDFRDTGEHNTFLLIDFDKQSNIDDLFTVIQNQNSIQYFTFVISSIEDIEHKLSVLNKKNIKYVSLKITAPNVILTNELKDELELKYNIKDIKIEYDVNVRDYDKTSIDNVNIQSIDIDDIFKKININIDEFLENNSVDDIEKMEILYILLESLFTDNPTSEENKEEVYSTINKYFVLRKQNAER